MSLFEELKRRRVIQVGVAYVAIAWVLAEVADYAADNFGAPDWVVQIFTILLMLLFPVALFLAWAFELTPKGIRRDSAATGSELTDQQNTAAVKSILPKAPDESIAVLPFENMSNDPEQEYFSDGLTEEILNTLAQSPDLRVAGRTSSFQFKGKTGDFTEIGEKLNVAHVLEGSVRKAGNRIRITVQLIKVADGYHLWSQSYDRDLEDIFAIQDDIAGAVSQQLQITLLGAAKADTAIDPEAYSLYLLGRHFLRQSSESGYQKAADTFENVLAQAPDYVPAMVGLGIAGFYLWASYSHYPDSAEAEQPVRRALTLDSSSGAAHAVLGLIQFGKFDFAGAEASLSRAQTLAPGDADVLRSMGILQYGVGDLSAALDYMTQAIAADPLNARTYNNRALFLLAVGDPQQARASALKARELSPFGQLTGWLLCEAHLALSEPDEALRCAGQEPEGPFRLAALAIAHHAMGQSDASDRYLSELMESAADNAAIQIATVYARCDDVDGAFEWLDRAWQQRDPGLSEIRSSFAFNTIRNDPRYTALLRKLNLA